MCEIEKETWIFDQEENPVRNSVEGIYQAILQYQYGEEKHEAKANYWVNRLLSLAANGDMMAGCCQYRLADMYENGDGGVLKDAATARMWYRKAFDNGYSKAQIYL